MTDLALQWMSFRRSGNIAHLRAVLTHGINAHRLVDDLAVLGHAEWTGTDNWRIAPPVLAGLPHNGGAAAVLCGARTPALLEALNRASTAAGAQITYVPGSTAPAAITVAAPSPDALAQTAEAVGVPLQMDAALRILACTPSIREWQRTPCPMVQGRVDVVRRFSRSHLGWVPSTLAEAAGAQKGLFRIKRDFDWVSLLKSRSGITSLIDDRVGRLAVAIKCKVVRWSPENRVLSLPLRLYPPMMMARGLVLCSGYLPTFDWDAMTINFAGVEPAHLRLILALTELRLK